jgi:uncharacterized protein YkwD
MGLATAALAALLLVPAGASAGAGSANAGRPAFRPAAMAVTRTQQEDRFAARVLALVNNRRRAHGLRPLRVDGCVHGFAGTWAQALARRNELVHSDLNRLMLRCRSSYGAENIAELPPGYTPAALVRLWMHSPAHRHNILSARPTTTGVGVRWDTDRQAWLAVQDFARRRAH